MAISKNFQGKKYLLTRQVDTKKEAEDYAETLRIHGYFVRIIKTNKVHKYHIYRRASDKIIMGSRR